MLSLQDDLLSWNFWFEIRSLSIQLQVIVVTAAKIPYLQKNLIIKQNFIYTKEKQARKRAKQQQQSQKI